MSTTSPKPATKRVKTAIPAPATPVARVEDYVMPVEVANWVKQAEARITYLVGKVEDLREENAILKKANRVMEARVLGQSQE